MNLLSRLIRALYAQFPWLLAVNRRKIDISAKCPACGVVKAHVIKWNPITRLVVHTCARCAADFAQEPIIKVNVWQKRVIEERE